MANELNLDINSEDEIEISEPAVTSTDILNDTSNSAIYNLVDIEQKVCPHCWHEFVVNEVLYISQHSDLWQASEILGEGQVRFKPTHFNKNGQALDEKGSTCKQMACPHCHLHLPVTIMDLDSVFFSIVGAPASGKSYFLASMIRSAKKTLANKFNLSFADADPVLNQVINNYEKQLFMNPQVNQPVALEKTQVSGGDMYDSVKLGGRSIDLPKPFIYKIQPYGFVGVENIPPKNIILYDNAGEHYLPGMDNESNLGTQHLAHSDAIMFIFDSSLDPRLRPFLSKVVTSQADERLKIQNQEVLLSEILSRLHKNRVVKSGEKYSKPFLVILSKFDKWDELLNFDLMAMFPIVPSEDHLCYEFDSYVLMNISFYIREILLDKAPEFVTMVEAACSNVIYIPNSAIGRAPELLPDGKTWGIKPQDIAPIWAEIPLLILMTYLNLIPVNSCNLSRDIIDVKKYHIAQDMVTFIHPGTRQRCHLPRSFFGQVINDYERGIWFRIPSDTGDKNEVLQKSTNDFWENL